MSLDFRILDFNWAQRSSVNVAATSEDANFPATNVRDNPHRTAVWRSSGYFELTSSINKLDFKESGGGSEKSVAIPVGNYTASELEFEVKNQMEAVSGVGATYTVSLSATTGKWTIATDQSFLSLLWSSGSQSGSSIGSTLGFATSADDTGATSYTGASIALHTVERLVIDLVSTNEPVDSFALVFPPEDIKLTNQATLKLRANATNVWTSPSVDESLTIDENLGVATHFFSSDQAYRYWAVEVTDSKNPNLFVELSKVILAKATTLDHGPEVGFSYEIADTSDVESTEFGHEYHDLLPNRTAFGFNLRLMPVADQTKLANIYNRVGRVTPVAIALDADAELFDKDRFFLYGRLSGSLSQANVFRNNFDQELTLTEAL